MLKPLPGAKRSFPDHLLHATTLRGAFTLYCDIRSLPEKKWLRLMAEYASVEEEKMRLLYLCSRQGNFIGSEEVEILRWHAHHSHCYTNIHRTPIHTHFH